MQEHEHNKFIFSSKDGSGNDIYNCMVQGCGIAKYVCAICKAEFEDSTDGGRPALWKLNMHVGRSHKSEIVLNESQSEVELKQQIEEAKKKLYEIERKRELDAQKEITLPKLYEKLTQVGNTLDVLDVILDKLDSLSLDPEKTKRRMDALKHELELDQKLKESEQMGRD